MRPLVLPSTEIVGRRWSNDVTAAATACARPKSRTFARPLARVAATLRGLQIAVDDAFLVRGSERFADLPCDGQRLGASAAGPRSMPLGQRLALDELQDEAC